MTASATATIRAATDVVIDRGFAPTPDVTWAKVKAECDAVLLPYSLDPADHAASVYATHFPSKLTEYVALGMPVVVVGPPAATGVRWAARHPDAVALVTDDAVADLAKTLVRLRDTPDDLARVGRAHLLPLTGLDPLTGDQELSLGCSCRH